MLLFSIGEGGLQSLLGNMSHNQLMQLIGPTGLGGIGMYRLNQVLTSITTRDGLSWMFFLS